MADERKIKFVNTIKKAPVVEKIADKIEENKAVHEENKIAEQQLPKTFEERHEISQLKLFIIIVSRGQADAIMKLLYKENVAACFIMNGTGTGTSDIYSVIGGNAKKQIVYAVIKDEQTKRIIEVLNNRFAVSRAAKGIAFSVKLTSIAGVSIYKFLSNTQIAKEKRKWKR